jgi:membrane fusion protein, multidrug efflux system
MQRHSFHAALLVSLSVLLTSCSPPGRDPGSAAAAGRDGRGGARGAGVAVPVVTAKAEQRAVPVTVPAVGTVEAVSTVDLRSQVTGQLTAVHFTEGREVRQGDPLFSLDPRPFKAALLQAQAILARDTASLQNAQAQQARSDTLFQRGLLARDQYESQRAGTAALAATIDADKAAIETARLNVQYTEIASPITGRTGSLGVHVGDLIRANDTTPLVVVNQLSPIYVTFSVPGSFLADIRRYQAQKPLPVSAAAPRASGPDAAPARGVLSFIDNTVDPTTGTIRLKGTFPNAGHELWPGAFVQVTLGLTTQPDAIVVPVTAVQTSQDGSFVYVVKSDRTVEMRPIKVNRQSGDEVVIGEGLAAGEEVVTDGQLRLTPGARVSDRGATSGRPGTARDGGPGTAGGAR